MCFHEILKDDTQTSFIEDFPCGGNYTAMNGEWKVFSTSIQGIQYRHANAFSEDIEMYLLSNVKDLTYFILKFWLPGALHLLRIHMFYSNML